MHTLLRRSFRPEFLNRIDETIFFTPLSKAQIGGIIDMLMARLQKRLIDRQISVTLSDSARQYIIDNGYDPAYGARPLRRFLQSRVETLIGRMIIADEVTNGAKLTVDTGSEGLKVTVNAG